MKSREPAVDAEERILDGVDCLLARSGYKGITIENLASEVGLRKDEIYAHFPAEHDVMLAHIDRIVRDVLGDLRQIARTDDGSVNKIRRMLVARVMLRFDSVQHYAESITDVMRDMRSHLLDRRDFYFAAEAKIISDVITQGKRAGVFHVRDSSAAAQAVITATNSILPSNLAEHELNNRVEVEKRATQLAKLLTRALMDRNRLSSRIASRA